MFSPANSKLKRLYKVRQLRKWFLNKKGLLNKKVYSFDILSGHTCPYAHDCQSRAVETENGRRIQDGKNTVFRCFSASQEVIFTGVYNKRKANYEALKGKHAKEITQIIQANLPEDAGIVRIHVGGDFFNQHYFDAWVAIAINNPKVLFYAYTKSLPFWVNRISMIPGNFILTASRGGRKDYMIEQYNLRSVQVVMHPSETELEIDHDDSHAARPDCVNQDFALLIHGIQPKGKASAAITRLKKEQIVFSY